MSFVKKTPAEFEAMSEYQKEKYLDQKSAHEADLVKEQAEKTANVVIEAMKLELKAEREAEKLIADEALAKVAELAEKNGIALEEALATLKRAKVGEIDIRMKGFSDQIIDKLSTPEGEQMIKEFFAGQKEKFAMEVEGEALKATMGVPVGGVAPQFTPIVGPGHDEFHARNVIPVFPTTSNLIKFIQYVIDPDATGFGMVAVGGQKPDLGYLPTVKEASVRKIAGLLDVPDELMDDVVGFRAWIAFELPKAYLDAEDQQIFKGNGVGENLLGLWYQANYQTFLGSVTGASNTIDQIMSGITEVRTLKRATSAVFVSAIQWMEILINKGNTEEYTYPIILGIDGVMRIGNIPIFWTNIMLEKEGIVGDFARGTAIFQRKAMTIGYFDQNKDNVEKNIITIRLEGRLALPIFYPEAFLKLFPATT